MDPYLPRYYRAAILSMIVCTDPQLYARLHEAVELVEEMEQLAAVEGVPDDKKVAALRRTVDWLAGNIDKEDDEVSAIAEEPIIPMLQPENLNTSIPTTALDHHVDEIQPHGSSFTVMADQDSS